ncbi:Uncharacterised protein [Mycobacteroides abscessus subsp. abscessus]|nr:Uncharacterised protein [Mycobacteroides abscessus subsp. abscessus]
MFPQVPCPNGSHHPKRSATADRKAAASDTRSATSTSRIRSSLCMDSLFISGSAAQLRCHRG